MSQIFISYARSTESTAKVVAEALRGLGFNVWWDDDLQAHRNYGELIEEHLRAAKAVIAIWSAEAARSQWVRAEADLARQLGTLVQLSADGTLPPLPFNQIHCVDLLGWNGNPSAPGWRKVVESVSELLHQEPVPVSLAPPLPNKPSLAVMPFSNMANVPDQDYFVEGMMDEIITALTRIRALFVIASSATLCMKGLGLSPQDAARRLGVRYILEGSVRRSSSRIRVSVKLTDAGNNVQVWAQGFDGNMEDVFALQDQVAISVAGVIEPSIHTAEQLRNARSPVENLGAYDLYLRAASLRATLRKPDVMQALELLDRATALDPDFAPALAHAAGCHSQMYLNSWGNDRDLHRQQGLLLAERAERAASDDASVLTAVANAVIDLGHASDQYFDRATALIGRATTLNPGLAQAWFVSGMLKLLDGKGAGAIEDFERAARLDPISPLNGKARVHIGVGQFVQGNFEEALRNLLATSNRSPRVQLLLMTTYDRLGHSEQAREVLRSYEQETPVSAESLIDDMAARQPEMRQMVREALARVRQSFP